MDGMGWDDRLEAFLKDHEVEAEAWKSDCFFSVWSNYRYFFQNGSKFMRKDTSLLGKDRCKQLHSMHLLGNTTLSHCHTLKNTLALNIELHTLHQLQSFSVVASKNAKCKHHVDFGTNSF